jgi:hypothetical protein
LVRNAHRATVLRQEDAPYTKPKNSARCAIAHCVQAQPPISSGCKTGLLPFRVCPKDGIGRIEMKTSFPKLAERKCPVCDGTGFPAVKQPADPGRKIYPPRCENCGGKGRITGTAN